MGLDISLYKMSELNQRDLSMLKGKTLDEIRNISKDVFFLFQTDLSIWLRLLQCFSPKLLLR